MTSAEAGEEEIWADWSGMFAEKGYTGIEIDITAPQEEMATKSVLDSMTTMLASQIRLMAIPFAPIIISSGGASTMLTQNYISSHPASGLVLVNPLEGKEADEMFDYEPSFPILVVNGEGSSGGRLARAAEQGTGRGGKGVEVEKVVDGERGEKTRVVSPDTSVKSVELIHRWWRDGWIDAASRCISLATVASFAHQIVFASSDLTGRIVALTILTPFCPRNQGMVLQILRRGRSTCRASVCTSQEVFMRHF